MQINQSKLISETIKQIFPVLFPFTVHIYPNPTNRNITVHIYPDPTNRNITVHIYPDPTNRKITVHIYPDPTSRNITVHIYPNPTSRNITTHISKTSGQPTEPINTQLLLHPTCYPTKPSLYNSTVMYINLVPTFTLEHIINKLRLKPFQAYFEIQQYYNKCYRLRPDVTVKVTVRIKVKFAVKVKVKQSNYRPGQALSFPGG
jgi:hypothetical protein